MNAIKSIMPILRGSEWIARIRQTTGVEILHGIGDGYTLAQAQVLCDTVRRDIAHHGIDTVLAQVRAYGAGCQG